VREADLHIHTSASDDSVLEPEQIFRRARARGLSAVAFTDHEQMSRLDEGRRLSAAFGIAFLGGIELTSSWRGQYAHILGYFRNGAAPSFDTFLVERVWPGRRKAHLQLLDPLQHHGAEVTTAEYDAEARAGGYHLPLYRILRRKGAVSNLEEYVLIREDEGFEGCYLPIPEVIRAIHNAGGIAVLAHPIHTGSFGVGFYRFDGEDIALLARAGLDGVEVFHPTHDEGQTRHFAQVADDLGLVKTGGSDSHGSPAAVKRVVGAITCNWDEVVEYLERRA